MNDRIEKKVLKKYNLKRQNEILNEISKHFTIENKRFVRRYNIMKGIPYAECHLLLKETPGWKYGIWLFKNNKFKLFGEHEELIDKFKPSASYIDFENDLQGFIQQIKDIIENPKLYFVDSLTYGDALIDYKQNKDGFCEGYQVIRVYNEKTGLFEKSYRDKTITQMDFVNKKYDEYFKEKEEERISAELDKEYAFQFFKEIPNMFDEIVAVGIKRCNWDYLITPVIKSGMSQDEFELLFDRVFELVREKRFLGEIKTHKHDFELDMNFYETLEAIRANRGYSYKFYKQNI